MPALEQTTFTSQSQAPWPRVRFDQILRRIERKTLVDDSVSYDCVGVRWYGNGAFVREKLLGSEISRKQQWIIRSGDVVYNKLFAWKGAFAVADGTVDRCIISDKFPTYELNRGLVDMKYIQLYFRTPPLWRDAESLSKGAAAISKLTLNPPQFWDLTIPLPALDEQRRIVARIEELSNKIQEAKALRQQTEDEAKALCDSILTHSLTRANLGPKWTQLPEPTHSVRRGVVPPSSLNTVAASWNVPNGWHRISVAELLVRGLLLDVKDGNHGSNHPRSSEFAEEGTPFLMASDIQDGKVLWKEASRLAPETISRLHVGFAQRGDVLFTHKASIGKTAIADRDCILSPQVTYYRSNESYIEPRWLQAFLGSSLFLSQLSGIQAQSTRDFVSIGKQYQQFLLLPPLPEQHRIASELDRLQRKLEALTTTQTETSAELDALMPSILDRAFRGEL